MDPNTPNPISPLPNFSAQPVSAPAPTPVNPDLVGDISPSVLSAPFVPSISVPTTAPVVLEAIPTIDPIVAPVTPAMVAPITPPPTAPVSPLVENPDDVKTIS